MITVMIMFLLEIVEKHMLIKRYSYQTYKFTAIFYTFTWFQYVFLFVSAWVLGWLMCKTVPYVQGLSVAASVYSLVAVSLDR